MKILWEQIVLPYQAKTAHIDALLSPGNFSPVVSPCPSAVIIHDLVPFKSPENFTQTERLVLKVLLLLSAKRASRIITVSKSTQKQILEQFRIPSEKTTVAYAACEEIFLSHQVGHAAKQTVKKALMINDDYILCMASTRQNKNLDRLLLAFSVLKSKHSMRHRLVITGASGRQHEFLINRLPQLGLNGCVVFTGPVSDDILPSLYGAASAFVYPSTYEGFGLPVLEAMACGVPVVTSNITSLPEVAGNAALLVNPYDVSQMAEAIHRVLTDPEVRSSLIEKGHKRVRKFSWGKTAAQVLEALETIE